MHLPLRSVRVAAPRWVRDRSCSRTRRGPQSVAPSTSSDSVGARPASRLVPGGRTAGSRRSIVRRAEFGRIGDRFVRAAVAGGTETCLEHQFERPTIAIRIVMVYQAAVEGRPSPCRFTPSCSSFAVEALHEHGTGRGLWLTVRRLMRCRPFGPSGWDPVPETIQPLARKRAAR